MKKLIILSIILLTTLSATLISNISESSGPAKKPVPENVFKDDLRQAGKLKLFSAKDYMREYERNKNAKLMLSKSLERIERTHSK